MSQRREMKIGYSLSSEETAPKDLVRYAVRAEQAGFSFALISDHFHPWLTRQGQSPFVWAVIGAIAQATNRIALGTGVTCPIMRIIRRLLLKRRRPQHSLCRTVSFWVWA